MTANVYLTIFLCGLVTWLIRVIPFAIIKNVTLPKWLLHFLSFVPVAILTAIFVESLLEYHAGSWPTFNVENTIAAVPTFISAILSKNLMVVVIVGIISMAAVRFFGF